MARRAAGQRKSTELEDPLKAAGLEPKRTGSSANGVPAGGLTTTSGAPGQPENSNGPQEKGTGRVLKPDEEKATEQVTAYFTTAQYDKIEELQRAYRKKAKKRITVNALLRRLVEHATVEDIL